MFFIQIIMDRYAFVTFLFSIFCFTDLICYIWNIQAELWQSPLRNVRGWSGQGFLDRFFVSFMLDYIFQR